MFRSLAIPARDVEGVLDHYRQRRVRTLDAFLQTQALEVPVDHRCRFQVGTVADQFLTGFVCPDCLRIRSITSRLDDNYRIAVDVLTREGGRVVERLPLRRAGSEPLHVDVVQTPPIPPPLRTQEHGEVIWRFSHDAFAYLLTLALEQNGLPLRRIYTLFECGNHTYSLQEFVPLSYSDLSPLERAEVESTLQTLARLLHERISLRLPLSRERLGFVREPTSVEGVVGTVAPRLVDVRDAWFTVRIRDVPHHIGTFRSPYVPPGGPWSPQEIEGLREGS